MGDKITVVVKSNWSAETTNAVLAMAKLAAQEIRDDSELTSVQKMHESHVNKTEGNG